MDFKNFQGLAKGIFNKLATWPLFYLKLHIYRDIDKLAINNKKKSYLLQLLNP